jgi:hypothetical protein
MKGNKINTISEKTDGRSLLSYLFFLNFQTWTGNYAQGITPPPPPPNPYDFCILGFDDKFLRSLINIGINSQRA